MNKKIGILTFHASHNFGSMLQNFALQHILKNLGYSVETINFRSQVQRYYRSGDWHAPITNWRILLRKIMLFPYRKDFTVKYNKFETFLQKDLACTVPYYTEEDVIKNLPEYDIYLAGGDQIWNPHASDFSWLYLLPFTAEKNVSYSASLGDTPSLTPAQKEKFKQYLSDFSAVSVREESAADLLGNFIKRPSVTLDPTLLLSSEEWVKYIDKEPLVKGDYLFVYSPYRNYSLKQAIPSGNTMPLVLSTVPSWSFLYNKHFIKRFDTGPWDFLNLIYYSKGVVSGSFHAAVFAKLFNKPLYCIDMGPESRIVNLENKFKNLDEERKKSIKFLQEALK